MERRVRRHLREFPRRDRRISAGGRALSRRDRDSDETLRDAIRFRDFLRSLTEIVQRPGKLNPKDFETLTEPREVDLEAERCPAVNSDRLKTSVPIQEAAVPDREVRVSFWKDGTVKPREARPRSPPRGRA